jgi:hypothetical protein
MTDRNLTDEEWGYVSMCLNAIALSDPEGPTEREDEMYHDLLNFGFSEQWIAENMNAFA